MARSESGPNPVAYTNRFLLGTAKTYPELRLRSEAEYRFYTELKRRTDADIREDRDGAIVFEAGDTRAMLKDGSIYILRNGTIAAERRIADFAKRPGSVFRGIREELKRAEKKEN